MKNIIKCLIIMPLCLFLLSGCGDSTADQKADIHAAKIAKVKGGQMSTTELKDAFTKLADYAISPAQMVGYGSSNAFIQADIKKKQPKLEKVYLKVAGNTTQPALTAALVNYGKTIQAIYSALSNNNQTTYQQATASFSTQTQTISNTYFDQYIPQSIINYDKTINSGNNAK